MTPARWAGRYLVDGQRPDREFLGHDEHLDRAVLIRLVTGAYNRGPVRERLARLQEVRSPYLALIYDLVEVNGWIGVVEERFDEPVDFAANPLRNLYQLTAAVAALHEAGLAHGALDPQSFRIDPLGAGRLGDLQFAGSNLDDPASDRPRFVEMLKTLGIGEILDDEVRALLAAGATSQTLAGTLRDRIGALLLKGRHRAIVTWGGQRFELAAERPSSRFRHPNPDLAAVTFHYDGTRFLLSEATGEVLVNNVRRRSGFALPVSCVVALGEPSRPYAQRYFITFDQAHPEVA